MKENIPSWKFEKGNTDEMPTVHKSESPINRENISEDIIDFLKETSKDNAELIGVADF